ncbi:peptidase, M16 family [Campylobacter blaseri]|uniref:Peptidase M16 n=1 Tax=Campylobacter blaseri TaxID=2042961 RepID=A0A2P8QZW4_9BACT|nr:pitrilysin family protein [Campylobacter blaseri]PSM51783.1 peptidase M16 [Campylobacter blaseri]PSM53574.1 peptidase M16 [Campylobacter blaseri]QKF86384.1 peptidase, M16 family [Campylobacter blaseri]
MEKIILEAKNTQIPLLFEHDDSLPVVNLKLIFKVAGSVADSKMGLSRLCARLLNEGTKELGSNEYARLLEIKAIELHSSSGFETFSIELNCLKEHFSYAFSMLVKLLKDPNLTDDTLQKIKNIVKSQIAINENEFDYLAGLELNKILHPDTPRANPTIGTYESIESIDLKDVEGFIKEYLNLANLYIVLAGDVKLEEIDFSKALYALEAGEKRELPQISTSDEKTFKEIKKNSEQAYIYFGAPFIIKKDDIYKANVASFILGAGGFGSRLMEEIRVKRGLAYSIYARNNFELSLSRITGYLQTKNENKEEAIAVIKEEFEKFIKDGVSEDELKSAKDFLVGSVSLTQETMFQRVNTKQDNFYKGYEFDEISKRIKQIKELTLDELNQFIKAHTEIGNLSFAVLSK